MVGVKAPVKQANGQVSEALFSLQFSSGQPATMSVGTRALLKLVVPKQLPQREQLRREDLENRLSNFYCVKNKDRLPKVGH